MMRFSLVVFGVGLLCGISQGEPVGTCGPNSLNEATFDDTYCSVYHVCAQRGWVSTTCPQGRFFYPPRAACVDERQYNCVQAMCRVNVNCLNGGRCLPTNDQRGTCQCPSGFQGVGCETRIGSSPVSGSTCNGISCFHGGRCFVESGQPRCYCPSPYTGPFCGDAVAQGGTCPASSGQEVTSCNPACQNGGRCFEDGGIARCLCPDGYSGESCQESTYSCTQINCQNGGECKEQDGQARCVCPDTYAGKFCQRKVPTACAQLQCANDAPCKRVRGKTVCDCPDGFIGDRCQYADPCPAVQCLNQGRCEPGDRGQAICNCRVGYTGHFCEIALDCNTFTCYNGGKCKIDDNKRVCVCPERTHGERCEKRKMCSGDGTTPCKNGGKCVNSEDGFTCVCPTGRKGLFCENLRECGENVVCENGGTCKDNKEKGANCTCVEGFKGPRCEIKNDECGGCQNGGKCELPSILPPKEKKLCACPANFAGEHCETERACTIPCPEQTGASGERHHTFVFPDLVRRDYVYLCRAGRLTHLKYCDNGLWYNPFAMQCHTNKTLPAARLRAGQALYPAEFPKV